ncbi:Mu transposase C-terminal domain-containing protein [Paenibacillus sp. FSL R7-0216]|uniref:Mu transposase C-terminal domain-containing protein n=1 Tax=Paenibacillus sp. FSL R7-0216 TaxID=2921677 RepID=UPI0030DD5E78
MNIIDNLNSSIAYVTSKGLKFNKIFYTNPLMMQQGWFEKAENNGEWRVPVLYDTDDTSYIYLIHQYQISKANEISLSERNMNPEFQAIYYEALQALKNRLNQKKYE